MTETKYMKQLQVVTGPSGESIEKIFVKQYQQNEIRFSWWPNKKFVPRALDVTEEELLPLLTQAIQGRLFSDSFLRKLRNIIDRHLGTGTV